MRLSRKEYEKVARQAISEGIVLLRNENEILPLAEGSKLAVFGRTQNFYYKSGTGSGGMVNAPKVWGILDALKEENVELNQELINAYLEFDKTHPYDKGVGFGNEPWSQAEMPVSAEDVEKAAGKSDIAIVIIGRTAGEEQDYAVQGGSYCLSEDEIDLLKKVRASFKRMIVLMNVSAVLDMQAIEEIRPEGLVYVWQGGELGGLGTVDVLMGRTCPSGKLVDSIVRKIEDAPASPYFGRRDSNSYCEDIYVGYRYYETFHPDAVLYPFGYGLSYTKFEKVLDWNRGTKVSVTVKNIGQVPGKEVVQIYVSAPQGKLGKAKIQLAAFAKTKVLEPGEKESLVLEIDPYLFASYDDLGVTGHKSAYVLEEGAYTFYLGDDSKHLTKLGAPEIEELRVLEQLSTQMAPKVSLKRMHAGQEMETVPAVEYDDVAMAKADQPSFKAYTGDRGIKLVDVRDGSAAMEDFLAQLSDEDLTAIIRGEGMGSPKVTAGTAAAFGGISPALKGFGIPCGCCSDGPSGMRLDCGTRAFSLPSGTMLACTWNVELNEELYRYLGMEMTKNRVDVLLGPGINIHRHPLNGRNFEYFSEEPIITGKMAAAQIRGLKSAKVSGTLKHFCGNNQETNRHGVDSVISERALREIYLKGFELAVKEGGADSVMTTYGAVNGEWTNSRHDLNTCILREEWGFKGIVMTDWWSNIGDVGGKVSKNDFARLVLAQNDFYAVCPDASTRSTDDNTLEELKAGHITRGQLVRCADNICTFLMNTHAMEHFLGEDVSLELEGFEDETENIDPSSVTYYEVKDGTVIDLSVVDTQKGSSYVFGIDAAVRGCYYMDMVGKSDLSELAQIPVAVFFQSIAGGTFTFHGTAGEYMAIQRKILFTAKYGVMRLYFGGSGLQLKEIRFTFEKVLDEMNWDELSEYIYG